MKRRLLIIAICLLAGAVVNVALVWVLALHVDRYPRAGLSLGGGRHPGDGQYWACVASKRFGSVMLRAAAFPAVSNTPFPVASVPHWSRLRGPLQRAPDQPSHNWLEEHATGWPMLAMVYRAERFAGGSLEFSSAIEISDGGILGSGNWLPTEVIWPGFLVNTLFYGGILWLTIRGPSVLRAFLRYRARLRAGKCPTCGYPWGQSPVCTECGRPLPRRRTPDLT